MIEAVSPGPDPARPTPVEAVAALLLAATAVLHVVAMVPDYFVGSGTAGSLFSQTDQAALYSILAAAWALALAIGLTGPGRIPLSAGLAAGVAATEFGFRFSDVGSVIRYGTSTAGAGLWLMAAAWVVGAAGTVLAVIAARRRVGAKALAESERNPASWTFLVGLLALALAGAFLPPWDHYREVATTTGRAVSFNLGNAFTGPWEIILGNVVVALALIAVPIAASRWRDRGVAAAATCGVLMVMLSEFVSAVVQVDHVSPAAAGLTPGQVSQLGLVIDLKLTGWFTWDVLVAFALFVAVMVRATARPVQEDSPALRPSAPDWRNPAIPSAS